MQVSGKGAAIGLMADLFLRTFPLGTGIGALLPNLFQMNSGDVNQAYDANRATRGQNVSSFGDLKGMAQGLFGDLFGRNQAPQARPNGGEKVFYVDPQGVAHTELPTTNAEAETRARPRADEGATQEAQQKGGFDWKKALLWGGAAVAGLTLLNNTPFFGNFGMPFYGAGMGMSPLAAAVMPYNPMMPYGFWW